MIHFFDNLRKNTLFCEFTKGYKQFYTDQRLGNQADFELNMITQYLLQILGYHVNFKCYCTLTGCSQPIRVLIVSLIVLVITPPQPSDGDIKKLISNTANYKNEQEGYKINKPPSGLLILISQISHLPQKLYFSAKYLLLGRYLSLRRHTICMKGIIY